MIAGIVLAAGSSSRLGRPKQLLPYQGRPLLQHAVEAAAVLDEVVVVLGHAQEEVSRAIEVPAHAHVVHNLDHAAGQSTSLRAGLEVLHPRVQAAVVLLGDQPGVGRDAVQAVADAWEGGPIVQARWDGHPGHPVLFSRALWEDLTAVEGDKGARDILRRRADEITWVDLPGPPPPDVDTEDDYRRLLRRPGSA